MGGDPVSLPDAVPSRYGAAKLATMRTRWVGECGLHARGMAPQVFPTVPVHVFVGFTAIAMSQREETSAGEMGLYQPPRAAWKALQSDREVKALLGDRKAVLTGWRERVADQTAVGLVNVRNDGRKLAVALRGASAPSLVAVDPASPWAIACAFTGFSAGPTSGAQNIARYRVAILSDPTAITLPEGARVAAWVRAIVAEYDSGHVFGPSGAHARNPAHSAMRLLQKLCAGRALALAVSASDDWWRGLGFQNSAEFTQLEQRLVGAAFNVRTFGR